MIVQSNQIKVGARKCLPVVAPIFILPSCDKTDVYNCYTLLDLLEVLLVGLFEVDAFEPTEVVNGINRVSLYLITMTFGVCE